jgi:hypothetical protein
MTSFGSRKMVFEWAAAFLFFRDFRYRLPVSRHSTPEGIYSRIFYAQRRRETPGSTGGASREIAEEAEEEIGVGGGGGEVEAAG